MVRTFLVECYLPGVDEAAVADAGRRACGAVAVLRDAGHAITFSGSTFVPADEVVFHEFAAADAAAVERASRLAGLAFERIVEATSLPR